MQGNPKAADSVSTLFPEMSCIKFTWPPWKFWMRPGVFVEDPRALDAFESAGAKIDREKKNRQVAFVSGGRLSPLGTGQDRSGRPGP